MYNEIENIRTIIAREKVKQYVLVKIKGIPKEIYFTPKQIFQNTNLEISQIEALVGEKVRLDFYSIGEKMFSGKICDEQNFYIKDYFFKLDISKENLLKEKADLLKLYYEVIEIWPFLKNGFENIGIKLSNFNNVYLGFNWFRSYTGLRDHQIKALIGSFMNPIYYQKGEKMYTGKLCYSDNYVIKELDIRFKNDFEKEMQLLEKTIEEIPCINNSYSERVTRNVDWDDLPFSDPGDYFGSDFC